MSSPYFAHARGRCKSPRQRDFTKPQVPFAFLMQWAELS
jgi:hypothetical protein